MRKLILCLAFLVALFYVATAYASDRVVYVDREVVEYFTGPDGKTHARTVVKSVATAVPDIEEKGEGAPTPHAEVERVLNLLPKPVIGFVDFGCGDARWCIAAAKKWGCKATGVEIDPIRAATAKYMIRAAGVKDLVTIIEGDATTTEVQADVGVAYLYPEVLEKLKPKLEKLTAFASYLHQPPGLSVVQNGDSWFYTKPKPVVRAATASWNGREYTGPVCTSPRCQMCNDIRAQLSAATTTQSAGDGQYVPKYCNGKLCGYVWVPAN